MRTKTKLIGAGALVAALAAGGSAFTDSNTGTSTSTAGYGTVSATGVNVEAVHYTIDSSDPSELSGVTVDVDTPSTPGAVTLTVKWNDGDAATCGTGSVDTPSSGQTEYVCTDEEPVSGATALAITALTS